MHDYPKRDVQLAVRNRVNADLSKIGKRKISKKKKRGHGNGRNEREGIYVDTPEKKKCNCMKPRVLVVRRIKNRCNWRIPGGIKKERKRKGKKKSYIISSHLRGITCCIRRGIRTVRRHGLVCRIPRLRGVHGALL